MDVYPNSISIHFVNVSIHLLISGKALFPGTSTMNQIDKIISCVPRPTRSDVESMKSPYAQSILDQLLRMYVGVVVS